MQNPEPLSNPYDENDDTHPAIQRDDAICDAMDVVGISLAKEPFLRGRIVELTAELQDTNALLGEALEFMKRMVAHQDQTDANTALLDRTGGKAGLDAPILGPSDLAAFLSVSTSTVDRMRKRGDLPEPEQLSDRKVCWTVRDAIQLWLSGKCRAVDNDA